MTTQETVLGWHFLADDRLLRYGDRRFVEVGETLSMLPEGGDPRLCHLGMHASVSAFDALKWAPGPVLCRVEISGDVLHGSDKICGRHRKVLWMSNATAALREWAIDCAERALPIYEKQCPEDARPRRAIEVARFHLRGEATDGELDAARDAAWAAARDAAWDPARDAAWAAARDAARAAAWAAARDAAWDPARDAAWDAARAAAWDAETKWQRDRLEQLMLALEPSA